MRNTLKAINRIILQAEAYQGRGLPEHWRLPNDPNTAAANVLRFASKLLMDAISEDMQEV